MMKPFQNSLLIQREVMQKRYGFNFWNYLESNLVRYETSNRRNPPICQGSEDEGWWRSKSQRQKR